MTGRPGMMLQFCRYAAQQIEKQGGYKKIEVRVNIKTSFNGRTEQYLVNPKVDLANQPRTLLPYSWIVPLTQPPRELWSGQ